MQKDIWLYSWDDEFFGSDEYKSREDAIQGAKEELKMTGEFGESWSSYIKDEDEKILDDRLNEVFEKWIEEFGYKPHWFVVRDTEEIELNEVANES
ncbi:hypothetical protein [Clostridioides sp. ZZV15-6597]|uniref:hypothetical protein n=1 Tax=Clostridioides sp. ZZV15-6597 TaxID=2811500 RepID=UPI001D121069|nr:hypothetical protein [Clostridioides sp. ZZV15-6597]